MCVTNVQHANAAHKIDVFTQYPEGCSDEILKSIVAESFWVDPENLDNIVAPDSDDKLDLETVYLV